MGKEQHALSILKTLIAELKYELWQIADSLVIYSGMHNVPWQKILIGNSLSTSKSLISHNEYMQAIDFILSDYHQEANIKEWFDSKFNGKILVDGLHKVDLKDQSGFFILEGDCRSIVFLYGVFENDLEQNIFSIKTLNRLSCESIALANKFIGYWHKQLEVKISNSKGSVARIIEKIRLEKIIEEIMRKHNNKNTLKVRIECMEKTGLGELSVQDKIKKIKNSKNLKDE